LDMGHLPHTPPACRYHTHLHTTTTHTALHATACYHRAPAPHHHLHTTTLRTTCSTLFAHFTCLPARDTTHTLPGPTPPPLPAAWRLLPARTPLPFAIYGCRCTPARCDSHLPPGLCAPAIPTCGAGSLLTTLPTLPYTTLHTTWPAAFPLQRPRLFPAVPRAKLHTAYTFRLFACLWLPLRYRWTFFTLPLTATARDSHSLVGLLPFRLATGGRHLASHTPRTPGPVPRLATPPTQNTGRFCGGGRYSLPPRPAYNGVQALPMARTGVASRLPRAACHDIPPGLSRLSDPRHSSA